MSLVNTLDELENAGSSDDPEPADPEETEAAWENFAPRRSKRGQDKQPGEEAAQKKQ